MGVHRAHAFLMHNTCVYDIIFYYVSEKKRKKHMFIIKLFFAVLVTIPIILLGMWLITQYYDKNIGNGGKRK